VQSGVGKLSCNKIIIIIIMIIRAATYVVVIGGMWQIKELHATADCHWPLRRGRILDTSHEEPSLKHSRLSAEVDSLPTFATVHHLTDRQTDRQTDTRT